MKNKIDCVLLDDDEILGEAWQIAATGSGLNLAVYRSQESLFKDLHRIDFETPIYVDSVLGKGVTGEKVTRELHERGFLNLYLSTGLPLDNRNIPWIKGVFDKTPPWYEEK